jgi:hypothetical protein
LAHYGLPLLLFLFGVSLLKPNFDAANLEIKVKGTYSKQRLTNTINRTIAFSL